MPDLRRLSWRDNGERAAVAVVANRLVAHGVDVRVEAGEGVGDYVVAAPDWVRRLLDRFGLRHHTAVATAGDRAAVPVATPRIAIFAGRGSAYPYYAYYAHCLAALGFSFAVVDAPDIAAGALDAVDLLVLPGGFAIWGLDRSEEVAGADEAVHRFLAKGGACIGSCGGAYYLSQGRPGWLGLAPAAPRYTHEYLRSGAGIVSVALDPGPLAAGCAPLVEMPYYHGPIYEQVRRPAESVASFCALSMPARLPINNPLDPERFAAEMAGKAAILTVLTESGSAVLFSPHPEMGDLVRKYVSLGSYVAHFLPIRGMAVMEQTVDFYVPNDSPAFRLVLNAVQLLCARPPVPSKPPMTGSSAIALSHHAILDLIKRRLGEVAVSGHDIEPLLRRESGRLADLAHRLQRELQDVHVSADRGTSRVLDDAAAFLSAESWRGKGAVQQLLDLELPLRFIEVHARQAEIDASIGNLRAKA